MANSPRARSQSRTRGSGRYYATSSGGGGGGAFDPATLTGVHHWLRAKDGVTTNAAYITAVTASSSFAGETPDRLFALNPSNTWDTNGTATGWVKAQLSTAAIVNSYTITYRAAQPNRMPKSWTFEGSNDNTNWTVLDTQANVTDWATALRHTYSFTNSTAYLYYRLNVSANQGDTYLSMQFLWFDHWMPVVSGAKSWVDAKTLKPVSTYLAGGGSTAAATPSGGTAATFVGSGGFVLGSLTGSAVEAWIVVKANGSTGTQLWKLGEVGDVGFYPYTDGKVYEEAGLPSGQRQSFTPSVAVSGWRIYRIVNDGTTWQAWIDNTSQATASSKAVTWPTTVGLLGVCELGNTLVPFSGQVAEVLIRNVKSTSGEVASLISYFNTEHGLTVT